MQDWSFGGQLTGTPASKEFRGALDQLVATPTKRPRAHLGSLALVQVDNLDHAIQRHGQRAGELLLDTFAAALGPAIAGLPCEVAAAPIGGGEFGILAPHTTALALADHLRAVPTKADPILMGHGQWSPTASIGISAVVAGEKADLPLARADQALTQARSLGRARIQVYDSSTHRFAADQIDFIVHIEALQQEIEHIHAEMLTDSLTGLQNRDALDAWLAGMDASVTVPSEILFIDFDRFHFLNHAQGQEAGDNALRRVAAALSETSRGSDLLFRRGGDEFVIVLPGTSRTDALRVAERYRQAVEALAIPHGGTPQTPTLTVTIGIASTGDQSAAAAIEAASKSAFAAKDRGAVNVALEAASQTPPGAGGDEPGVSVRR